MNIDRIMEQLKKDEGFSPVSFWDDAPGGGGGQWTWGYGTKAPGPNMEISEAEAELKLRNIVLVCVSDFEEIFKGVDICAPRAEALVNMIYNLGESRFRKFKKMIAAIKRGDWRAASDEARESLWYQQTGKRAQRIVKELRDGCGDV